MKVTCCHRNSDSGVITDSILTDETDLNQSAESTLQSPAFRRITIDDEYVVVVTSRGPCVVL